MSNLDSRQRFVLIYALVSSFPISAFTLLNVNDIGLYVSAIVIIYFVLRLLMNPKIRTRIDYLSFILLLLFAYFISEQVISILHP
ncbi:MAG TPA: hypothetical protein VJN71_10405 [Nitrososphaerales archaeon]|nr:hypothetical protein [Nitrososphaerales archaeon]